MKSICKVRRRVLKGLCGIAAVGCAPAIWAQNSSILTAQSEVGKRATRLADEVYVNAQDLSLLQEFSAPRNTAREKRAQQNMATAMSMLEKFAEECRLNAQAGKLPRATSTFVDDETEAARAVISIQASLYIFRKEEAEYALFDEQNVRYALGLQDGTHLKLLRELYGEYPGLPGTPQFYLGLLAWARNGFPPLKIKINVNTIEAALTPREVYLRKREQLVNPGSWNALSQKPGVNKGAVQMQKKDLINGQKDLSKAKALKGGM